ncbi:MAG: hypothetical protein U0414_02910 [Polyangiaceae bacterium]
MNSRPILAVLTCLPFVFACGESSPAASTSTASTSAKPASSGAPKVGSGPVTPDSGHADATPSPRRSSVLPEPTKPVEGFTPNTNGFKFQNYGNDKGYTNLTVDELRRMFGDKVCANVTNDKCTLTPAAEAWMEQNNKGMGGGHCEGFAALALLMQSGQIKASEFGADDPFKLEIEGNEKLQREIAYWFVTQAVMPMAGAEDKTLTPNDVVEKIKSALKNPKESYTLGIYEPGYKAGHATTPYGVVEKENGIVWIQQYDNNYPGEEKHIEVDTKANTWAYTTAADPNGEETKYKGDAETKTLTIAPSSVRTSPMVCGFCGDVDQPDGGDGKGTKGSAGGTKFNQILFDADSDATLLVTDENGKRLGYTPEGAFLHEIPGAEFAASKSGADDDPTYFIPVGHPLTVALSGAHVKKEKPADVVLVGPGYTMGVEGINLDPGQTDELVFSKDWSEFKYTTKSSEAPTIVLGIETSKADYTFELKVAGDGDGQVIIAGLDLAKGIFALNVDGGPAKSNFEIEIERIDEHGTATFKHAGLDVGSDQIAHFDYAAWKGDKTPMHVALTDEKGTVVSESDETDQ